MTSTNNTVAGIFAVVAADEVPTNIRRGGRGGQWAEAINALRDLEVGKALSLQVSKPAVATTRQNMMQANRTHGQGMTLITRTRAAVDADGNALLDSDNNPVVEIFFIKGEPKSDD